MFFFKLKILFSRIIGYDKPLRIGLLKYLTLKFKTFRPHYETILLESVLEAKKLGYKKVSVLELGVAGGNGIIALEKYKKRIEKYTNVEINIYGFDTGTGLPETKNNFDLPFIWSSGNFKTNKDELNKKIKSKIFYGDIKNTFEDFIKTNPDLIISMFFDLDYYTSTKNFLSQLPKFKDFLCPRVYCYFDDIFDTNHHINEHNGELLAIREFNSQNSEIKIGKSFEHSSDFKFPLGRENLFVLHNFNHKNYSKLIFPQKSDLSINDRNVGGDIFNF